MRKTLSVSKIQGVKIEDYYTSNYAYKGKNYDTDNIPQINYKIPLNAFATASSPFFEYRMDYTSGGSDYRVIYFKDLENLVDGEPVEDIPQEIISMAEWEAHRTFRDKYEIVLEGTDYDYDESYLVDYVIDGQDFFGKVRIITMSEDYNEDKTTLNVIEIDNAEL